MTTALTGPVCIVDVCGTLVRDDTTLGLLHWHFRSTPHRRLRVLLFAFLTTSWSPLRMAIVILERVTGRHLLKHLLVAMLAGDEVNSLDSSARDYAQDLLARRRVAAVWQQLESFQGPLVLASASLEPVVRALAETLGARQVSSSLASQDGRLTGRYRSDLTGRKPQALRTAFGDALLTMPYIAFSDNVTDMELLQGATQAFVILHRARHRSRWHDLSAEYLGIDA